MLKTKLRGLLLVSVLIIFSSYIAVDLVRADSNGLKTPKFNPKKDTIVTPTVQDISETLSLAGSIQADKSAQVKFQTSGELIWVGVKPGDRVRKGQALASIDKTELTKRFQKEANDYLTTRWNFEDTQDEYKDERDRHLITTEIQRILDRQQFTLNNAVLDYEIANLALKYSTIHSPINGLVVSVDEPNPPVNITPTTATITIVDPQSLYFDTEIDEEDVIKIFQNQQAVVKLDSFPDKTFNSKITYISFTPKSGQSSTVYQVKLSLDIDNSSLLYRLGMNGDCQIVLNSAPQSLTIPLEAITEKDSKYYVLLKKGEELVYQPVETGIESDTDIAITQGLNPNDQIVIQK